MAVLLAGPSAAFAQFVPTTPRVSANSFLGALAVLPQKYTANVMKVSADDGNPDPPQWYFLAYRGSSDGGLFSITIADGKILQEKVSLNLGQLFKNPSPIAIDRIEVDSSAAFEIARGVANANGKRLGAVSYILLQKGASAVPLWQIWCYTPSGGYFGYLEIAATDGTVLSTDGFSRRP